MALIKANFISYILRREVHVDVILPSPTIPESLGMGGKASHSRPAPLPVLYLLHGMGNNETNWVRYTNVERYAEERQIAVVMPAGENQEYRNQPGPGGNRQFDFIAYELPEFVQANFPVSDRREDTYIAGLSMGSMGSLLHSFCHPERFRAVGSFSGPLMQIPKSMNEGGGLPDYAAMSQQEVRAQFSPDVARIEQAAGAGGLLPDYYVACGKKDFLFPAAVAFADHLKSLGLKVTVDFEKDYGHEWYCWDENIAEFMDWLPRTDAYAGSKRQI